MVDTIASPMNPGQSRIIDPILSTIVQGFRNASLIGDALFPRVPVPISGGQVIEFGKEAFMKYAARRTWGGATKRVQFGYQGKPFALVEDSLEAPVPREWLRDAAQIPGIDLGSRATKLVMNIILRMVEEDQAALALNAANYDNNHKVALSGSDLWTDASCDLALQFDDYKEAIRQSIGQYPNVGLLSAVAYKAAKNNPVLKDHFKYTGKSSITIEMLQEYLEIPKIVVGKAVNADDTGAFTDIWGNNAVLAYVPQGDEAAQEVPSYGYTYTMMGHPLVEVPYYDNNAKSWIYGVAMERNPQLTGMTAGYLIQTPSP